mmetsp:Transcript_25863/g.83755  ORF Transcript_25863/g.83755 Transcript_25863/m.83755 type:complete len:540 (+) Transcript_25863:126-1745(+)
MAQAAKELKEANKLAAAALKSGVGEGELMGKVEEILSSIETWPTQCRPNVSPDEKAVSGFCLGLVNVLGGIGLAVSKVSTQSPELTKLVAEFVRKTVPRTNGEPFPFSSIQVNFCYAAKKHVDGNNIGPSYICSLGEHTGGKLWVADTFVAGDDGVLRGGGGETTVDCHRGWRLFNGNATHYTLPFSGLRISIIAFTHSSYNKCSADVASDLRKLGFTAGNDGGTELPYFLSFRLDKTELEGDALDSYYDLKNQRTSKEPPSKVGSIVVECNGYTAGRGAGFITFATGKDAKRAKIDAFVTTTTTKNPARRCNDAKKTPLPFDLPKEKNNVSRKDVVATFDPDLGVVRLDLPRNRTGFWLAELERTASTVKLHSLERFDVYKDTNSQTKALTKFVDKLPDGRVVVMGITDTAMAASRPLGKPVYDALRKLGAPEQIEPIGYRQPFGLIGIKGSNPGDAILVLEKTKIIVHLEARAEKLKDDDDATTKGSNNNKTALVDKKRELVDITSHILECKKDNDAGKENDEPPASASKKKRKAAD